MTVYDAYVNSLSKYASPAAPSPMSPAAAVSDPAGVLGIQQQQPSLPAFNVQQAGQQVGNIAGAGLSGGPAAAMAGFSGSYAPSSAARNGFTRDQFARDLLTGLGAPVTNANLAGLDAWMRAEGGNFSNSAAYNPLNTTLREPGSFGINSNGGHPVQGYTSYQEGLDATLATLKAGYYGAIRQALASGTNPYALAAAVAASPWGTGRGVYGALGSVPAGAAPAAPAAYAPAPHIPAPVLPALPPPPLASSGNRRYV